MRISKKGKRKMSQQPLEDAPVGVLNEELLQALHTDDIVRGMDIGSIDGSAFDLHLSDELYELQHTAKLTKSELVTDLLKQSIGGQRKLNGTKLERGKIYIIKLKETLHFDQFEGGLGLYGRASGKSSMGRMDILTRLLVDRYPKYDEVPPSYNGSIYLEVIPISFNILLKEGMAMHQLRVFKGHPELSRITPPVLAELAPMLYTEDRHPVEPRDGILTVNLTDKASVAPVVAFRAKDTEKELDLSSVQGGSKQKISPTDFWETIPQDAEGLAMEKNAFYILRSKERLFLPNDIAVSCVAYSENLGELRIHYAGFAHPNFGRRRTDNLLGAPLIFEARCHSFAVKIRDSEQFAKIEYYRMAKPSTRQSQYTSQELKLSNYFDDFGGRKRG